MCVILITVFYIASIIIWTPFQTILSMTSESMNYAGPIMGTLILMALVHWVILL